MLIKLGHDCYARAEDVSYFIADFWDSVARFTFKDGSTIKVAIEKPDNPDDDTGYINDYMETIADLINNKS